MMMLEELVFTIIGLRISRNDAVSQDVIEYLLVGCIFVLWIMSIGLGIECVLLEYGRIKKWDRLGIVGIFCCVAGLLSVPKMLFIMDDRDPGPSRLYLYAQLAEIAAASTACAIWFGKLKFWILAAIHRVRLAFLHEPIDEDRCILPQTSKETTTVSLTTTSTSLPMTALIRQAIADAITAASGAQVLPRPSITAYTTTEYTCETIVYHFTTSDPSSSSSPPMSSSTPSLSSSSMSSSTPSPSSSSSSMSSSSSTPSPSSSSMSSSTPSLSSSSSPSMSTSATS